MAYKVINGFNYPGHDGNEIRVEEGTILEELPADYAEDILAAGCVEEIDEDFTTGPLTEPEEE